MDNVTDKKIRKSPENFFLNVFVILAVLSGVALYLLSNYFFIKPEEEFDLTAQNKAKINARTSTLKSYDFSLFKSQKFGAFREGYWHIYDKNSLKIGNQNPFLLEK